jgi:hypothetical protein
VHVERARFGRARVSLWTGLLVRPDAGTWLRVSGTANRRNVFVEVDETFVPDDGAMVPLMLELTAREGAPDRVRLAGEIATVAPVAPTVSIDERSLAEVPDVGRAHAAFYDAAYFASKKREPTRKYRHLLARRPRDQAATAAASERACAELVIAGPTAHTVAAPKRFACADGPTKTPPAKGTLPSIVFQNLVPFEARYDGHSLVVEPDRRALAAGARAVEQAWSAALGATFLDENKGALWYLTKYFTPHPPGEPHFFVKPWAFTRTPPGWSCLLEGAHGDGWDVLRGVVSTDTFFATPAVFHVLRLGEPIRVGAGEPLLTVTPIPRALLTAGFREERWRDG